METVRRKDKERKYDAMSEESQVEWIELIDRSIKGKWCV